MIQINDKIRITRVDDKNLQIEELRNVINPKTKLERKEWIWVGYYGDLKSAIAGVLRHLSNAITDEEVKGCYDIIYRLNEVEKTLKDAIVGKYE